MVGTTKTGLGPLMVDIDGQDLTAGDVEILIHPAVGGVILFARNFESPAQIRGLCARLRGLRDPPLLIAVDQEGGRVQRFRNGFTRLPAPRTLGRCYADDPEKALRLARMFGWLLATEVCAVGVDFSFAPVLDLDTGACAAIGDRALHGGPRVVAALGVEVARGIVHAGSHAVAKHFPGHGHVNVDSHLETPIDTRPYAQVLQKDLVPFLEVIQNDVAGIMPAHVVFPATDGVSAVFSRRWIEEILRGQLGFRGAVFSDDLSMGGAVVGGSVLQRVRAALAAGCDMALLCNDRAAVCQVLEPLAGDGPYVLPKRVRSMRGASRRAWPDRSRPGPWRDAIDAISSLAEFYPEA